MRLLAELNDRAADIWEPLLVIADLAGGPWPARAREAAVGIATSAPESNLTALLLFDIVMQFAEAGSKRMFSLELVQRLATFSGRSWGTLLRGKPIDERWLARRLHPYGIRPRNLRIEGQQVKGYELEEVVDVCKRYVSKSELKALVDELRPPAEATPRSAPGGSEGPAPGGNGHGAGL